MLKQFVSAGQAIRFFQLHKNIIIKQLFVAQLKFFKTYNLIFFNAYFLQIASEMKNSLEHKQ